MAQPRICFNEVYKGHGPARELDYRGKIGWLGLAVHRLPVSVIPFGWFPNAVSRARGWDWMTIQSKGLAFKGRNSSPVEGFEASQWKPTATRNTGRLFAGIPTNP